MTSSDLGLIFADGNLITGFNNFEKDHKCNKYCRYFDLSTEYSQCEESSNSNTQSNTQTGTDKGLGNNTKIPLFLPSNSSFTQNALKSQAHLQTKNHEKEK